MISSIANPDVPVSESQKLLRKLSPQEKIGIHQDVDWLLRRCEYGGWHPILKVLRISPKDYERFVMARELQADWFVANYGKLFILGTFLLLAGILVSVFGGARVHRMAMESNYADPFLAMASFLCTILLGLVLVMAIVGAYSDQRLDEFNQRVERFRRELLAPYGLNLQHALTVYNYHEQDRRKDPEARFLWPHGA